MSSSSPRYNPLSEKELQEQWKKQKAFIEGFINDNQYNLENNSEIIKVDEDVVLSIITKVHQRKSYFYFFHQLDMSEYKEVALICFWCIKLKPIFVQSQESSDHQPGEFDSINEKLAVYYIFKTLRAALSAHKMRTDVLDRISTKYLNELIYTFTFRDVSKEAMIMLVESMAVFLGLDPYAKP